MPHLGKWFSLQPSAVCLATTTAPAQDFEIVDGDSALDGVECTTASACTPTQRHGGHACPPNRYVTGVFNTSTWGVFLCALLPPGYNPNSDEHPDNPPGTQFVDPPYKMHACPRGSVMSGINPSANTLLCVPSPLDPGGNDPTVIRFVDDGKEDEQGGRPASGDDC